MIEILRATSSDVTLIAEMAARTFIAAHSSSASVADIQAYVDRALNIGCVTEELADEKNLFHIVKFNGKPAGYSKLVPNCAHPKIDSNQVAKLERIYLLEEFHGQKLGLKLLEFNIGLTKELDQAGLWLVVWVGNQRAIDFYHKAGFEKIGETSFKISETHSNPNYWMYLKY